jgi:hypothetical protein
MLSCLRAFNTLEDYQRHLLLCSGTRKQAEAVPGHLPGLRQLPAASYSGLPPEQVCGTLHKYYTENSKHIFPEKELRGLSPSSYMHVSVCDLYIPTIGLPKIGGPIVGVHKSLIDT